MTGATEAVGLISMGRRRPLKVFTKREQFHTRLVLGKAMEMKAESQRDPAEKGLWRVQYQGSWVS